jgi:electron transfer flavoprotein alpha subunit
MRIAALLKQIPAMEELELAPDGRLMREGHELEMNPYCRRAASQAVQLVTTVPGEHHCSFVTLGPPSAEAVLREALAWALERGASADGVLITDPAFAGSDTLATARALAKALELLGGYDLVLVGRNSVDADTGQVGPELAQLLDLPFLSGVRHLSFRGDVLAAICELDDGGMEAEVDLPAIVSTAERLIDPCKVNEEGRASVPATLLRTLSASELGPGPWGQAGSPTTVAEVRMLEHERARVVLEGSIESQVSAALELLEARSALREGPQGTKAMSVPAQRSPLGAAVGVIVEPGRPHETRELLGTAAMLAAEIQGHVVALSVSSDDEDSLASWGADTRMHFLEAASAEDAGAAIAGWAASSEAWAVLAPSTAWGREVASRAAALLEAGLTGDAVSLELHDGRLRAWKSAFGGQLVAAIDATSPVQMATVRVGVLPLLEPRAPSELVTVDIPVERRGRVRVLSQTRDDDLDILAEAQVVVGVGRGVDPAEYAELDPLLQVLGAELGATRKVTDAGWLPRARQIGITGRSIAPRLFISIGASGKFNHMVGVRAAGTVLAVNPDPEALVFSVCDIGIVGDWHEVVPRFVVELAEHRS